MRVAFGSVIYREGISFSDDFTESINQQTMTNDVDVVLLNDNLCVTELKIIVEKLEKKPIIIPNCEGLSPHQLRVELIRQTKIMGYNLLVLGDFDDTWSSNRIEQYIKQFDERYTFFYNDLYRSDGGLFFARTPSITNSIENILEENYLGLSTTALNLSLIDEKMIEHLQKCPNPIFDWYLYSLLLTFGHGGKKILNAKTYYRLYEENLAGATDITIEKITKELNVKVNHYSALKDFHRTFQRKFNFYNRLKAHLVDSQNILLRYVDYTNDYWWGSLKEK